MSLDLDTPLADATEPELVRTAQAAVSQCNWVVGRCAAVWTQRYARGRTDADFAQQVGLSADQVYQRRRVWETFGDVYADYHHLRWSHFYLALNWDDAPECLQWADENTATVAEMRAWRKATRGEDFEDLPEESSMGDDPNIQRLQAFPSHVRDPDDEGSTPGEGRRSRGESDGDRDDVPFIPGTVSSAARDKDEDGEYAPFRKDAGSPGREATEETAEDDRPITQIARRVISTLERVGNAVTPQVANSFRSLPEKDKERLREALRVIQERFADFS